MDKKFYTDCVCVIVGYFDRGLRYSRCEYNVKSFCVRRACHMSQACAARLSLPKRGVIHDVVFFGHFGSRTMRRRRPSEAVCLFSLHDPLYLSTRARLFLYGRSVSSGFVSPSSAALWQKIAFATLEMQGGREHRFG